MGMRKARHACCRFSWIVRLRGYGSSSFQALAHLRSLLARYTTAGGCKGQKATGSMRTWCGYIGEDGWIVANLLRRIVFPSAVDGIGHLCSHLI